MECGEEPPCGPTLLDRASPRGEGERRAMGCWYAALLAATRTRTMRHKGEMMAVGPYTLSRAHVAEAGHYGTKTDDARTVS